jgi:hypothetical protein
MNRSKRSEINRNYEKFVERLPDLVREHEGEYALIRNGDIKGFFPSAIDAQIAGNQMYSDTIFSIQCVKETVEQLGYFSYAADTRKT